MIFVVSGEGVSDIGSCSNAKTTCCGKDFCAGPMAVIIEKLIQSVTNYSLLDTGAFEFVSESHLKTVKVPRSAFRGKKSHRYETALTKKYFYQNARQLARVALDKAKSNQCSVGAILFRDADGTRSTERGLYDNKWKSIEVGFQAEDFSLGIPMVPNPKSEAWLLCALQHNRYQNCARLESDLSGNDNSPVSAKKRLKYELDRLQKSFADLADMVADETVDAASIDMPSYNRFRDRLHQVACTMLGLQSGTKKPISTGLR